MFFQNLKILWLEREELVLEKCQSPRELQFFSPHAPSTVWLRIFFINEWLGHMVIIGQEYNIFKGLMKEMGRNSSRQVSFHEPNPTLIITLYYYSPSIMLRVLQRNLLTKLSCHDSLKHFEE